MISTKLLFILFLIIGLQVIGMSQSGSQGCYGFDCKEKKWSVSLFTGFSMLGPTKDIKDQMHDSGLDDTRPAYNGFFGPIKAKSYPTSKTGLGINFETRYNLSKKSALNLTIGITNYSSVEGNENFAELGPLGNRLTLNSNLRSAAFNYVRRFGKGMGGLNIGPVIAWHTIKDDIPYQDAINTSAINPGINVGCILPFIQAKSWFLTFKANYTWLPDTEIGPYAQEKTLGYLNEYPEVYTSVFEKTHVRLSTLNFGISTGLRF